MNKSNYNNKQQTGKKNRRTIIIGSLIALIVLTGLVIFLVNSNVFSGQKTADLPNEGKGVSILKSDITEKASFYPYETEGTYMEVIAIRASDGTVRTALNTCQICSGSGRGYYEQEGNVLVCQNCGNRFTVDQVEIVKGGCNPVPIFASDKTEDEHIITISHDFLTDNKALFYNWN